MTSSPLFCSFCNKTFNVYAEWQSHMMSHLPPQIPEVAIEKEVPLKMMVYIVRELDFGSIDSIWVSNEKAATKCETLRQADRRAVQMYKERRAATSSPPDHFSMPVQRNWVVDRFSVEGMATEEEARQREMASYTIMSGLTPEVVATRKRLTEAFAAASAGISSIHIVRPLPSELPGLQALAIKITEIAIAHNKMIPQVIENYFTTRGLLLRRLTQTEGAPEQAGNLGEK